MTEQKMKNDAPPRSSGFADALRFWRTTRRLSQLDLALEANVSTRHLSYLETGRSVPSREMILMLADALLLPRATRNDLLRRAGFAPAFPTSELGETELAPLNSALEAMLANHAPWPAMVCDQYWNMIQATPAAHLLLDLLSDPDGSARQPNVIELIINSPKAADVIVNFDEVRWEMVDRLRLETLEAGFDPILADLERRLRKRLGQDQRAPGSRRALVPLQVQAMGIELSFLTAIAHFGTSEDVVVRDLRIELFFPADDATRTFFETL
jgi:transcriptional regulator with XRE-family HTH domain